MSQMAKIKIYILFILISNMPCRIFIKLSLKTFIFIFLVFLGALSVCVASEISDFDKTITYKVLNSHPHDPNAQTEGLIYTEGFLYEGTGPCLDGPSSLRKVEIETGKILQRRDLPEPLFGEGITIYGDRIIQLTYISQTGLIYEKESFGLFGKFQFTTEEGWGLTNDGEHLIFSDGTAMLHYLDPLSFREVKQLHVRDSRGPVYNLNELEFIEGEIYANVFQTPRIVRISPETGMVTGSLDLSQLLRERFKDPDLIDHANGIAYDQETGKIFITGKYWPNLFEIVAISKE